MIRSILTGTGRCMKSTRPSGIPSAVLPSRKGDEGSEVSLFLVDLAMHTCLPDTQTITVHCTCTNRDILSRLPFGNEAGDFEVEGIGSIKGAIALRKPTPTLRPPMGRNALWRLISHMALNYLSIVEDGKEALQEVLRLYNFSDSADLDKQISGIIGVSSKRHFARINSESGISFARGTQVQMEFDEEDFAGSGVYLFAAVLDRFLGLYAIAQQLRSAHCQDSSAQGGTQAVATTSGPSNPDVAVSSVERELPGRALSL